MADLRKLINDELERGKTQQEIGRTVGVSQGTVSNVKNGIIPRDLATIEKFARYFKVSVDELRGGQGGSSHAIMERQPPYAYASPEAAHLAGMLPKLDSEEVEALRQCAECFLEGDDEIKVHIIGQLKLLGRLVKPITRKPSRASPRQRKTGV